MEYVLPLAWRDWCTGAGQPAALLWLEGRTWLAGTGSAAEEALLAQGAVPVGLLRFDRDFVEGAPERGVVLRVEAEALLRTRLDYVLTAVSGM